MIACSNTLAVNLFRLDESTSKTKEVRVTKHDAKLTAWYASLPLHAPTQLQTALTSAGVCVARWIRSAPQGQLPGDRYFQRWPAADRHAADPLKVRRSWSPAAHGRLPLVEVRRSWSSSAGAGAAAQVVFVALLDAFVFGEGALFLSFSLSSSLLVLLLPPPLMSSFSLIPSWRNTNFEEVSCGVHT
jgi:hypothetical protein